MEVSGQLHAPAALPQGKEPLTPIEQETRWAPGPVWTRWWREKSPAPTGTQIPDHPARSPVLHHWAIPAPKLILKFTQILSAEVVLRFDRASMNLILMKIFLEYKCTSISPVPLGYT